jgi:uncharacterized cupin superfamily protein
LRSDQKLTVLQLSREPAKEPQIYYVNEHKLLSGNPKQTLWIEYESSDGEFCAGVWASDVGEWKVSYTEQEYCCILEGRNVLTDAEGNSQEFSVGMEFVVPRGFVGTWRVLEPTRKRFVIHEKSSTPAPRPTSDA